MVRCRRACVTTVLEFRQRCRSLYSILFSLLKTKDWEWGWQLHVRFLNRTAAPSRGKTPMVVGLDLNLSFRRTDLLRDLEKRTISDQRRHIRPKEQLKRDAVA